MTEEYTITIPCKPYVRRYLVNRFGNPVNLKADKYFYKYFQSLLERKVHRDNHRTSFKRYGRLIYHEEVDIGITEDTFQRWGYDMNRKAVYDFNAFVEHDIKKQARIFILTLQSVGWKRWRAIREFQESWGFKEDEYSGEAILQDIKRNAEKMQIKLGANIRKNGVNVGYD
jgi:hypothetical protein